jgi:hypothetical protein
MQRLQFLIPSLVSQLQLNRAFQGFPEILGLLVSQELTARWVEAFQPWARVP